MHVFGILFSNASDTYKFINLMVCGVSNTWITLYSMVFSILLSKAWSIIWAVIL